MPKKRPIWKLFDDLGLKAPPQVARAKKDKASGNNARRRPKGQRKGSR